MLVNLISALVLGFIALVIADITNDICQRALYPTPTIINVPSLPILQQVIEQQVEEIRIVTFDSIQAEIEALVYAESESDTEDDYIEALPYSTIGKERFVQSLPQYKVAQLKHLAKHRNLDKVHKLNKAQLIAALS